MDPPTVFVFDLLGPVLNWHGDVPKILHKQARDTARPAGAVLGYPERRIWEQRREVLANTDWEKIADEWRKGAEKLYQQQGSAAGSSSSGAGDATLCAPQDHGNERAAVSSPPATRPTTSDASAPANPSLLSQPSTPNPARPAFTPPASRPGTSDSPTSPRMFRSRPPSRTSSAMGWLNMAEFADAGPAVGPAERRHELSTSGPGTVVSPEHKARMERLTPRRRGVLDSVDSTEDLALGHVDEPRPIAHVKGPDPATTRPDATQSGGQIQRPRQTIRSMLDDGFDGLRELTRSWSRRLMGTTQDPAPSPSNASESDRRTSDAPSLTASEIARNEPDAPRTLSNSADPELLESLAPVLDRHCPEKLWPTRELLSGLILNVWSKLIPKPNVFRGFRALQSPHGPPVRVFVITNASGHAARRGALIPKEEGKLPKDTVRLPFENSIHPQLDGMYWPSRAACEVLARRLAPSGKRKRVVVCSGRLSVLDVAKAAGFSVAYLQGHAAEELWKDSEVEQAMSRCWVDYWVPRGGHKDIRGKHWTGVLGLASMVGRNVEDFLAEPSSAEAPPPLTRASSDEGPPRTVDFASPLSVAYDPPPADGEEDGVLEMAIPPRSPLRAAAPVTLAEPVEDIAEEGSAPLTRMPSRAAASPEVHVQHIEDVDEGDDSVPSRNGFEITGVF